MAGYAHPEMLVSTEWLSDHLSDPTVRVIEVDVDLRAYERGHIPGAVGLDWSAELSHPVCRDVLSREAFEDLCSRSGISPQTTVVFYGDHHNWFAAFGLWQFRYWGHAESRLRLLNGGRIKWCGEGRPMTTRVPEFEPAAYHVAGPDPAVRAMRNQVSEAIRFHDHNLLDVRSRAEFTGQILSPLGNDERAQRGGHIPGARNVPWSMTVNDDGTFRSADELRDLYTAAGVDLDQPTIAYCRIGERSAHTWFVLKYLLGARVSNYDGSWVEWGNLIGAPIEKP